MNDLVKAYQKYLEDFENNSGPFPEPISLKVLTDCGLSDYGIVVYLRFVDLLRSCAMISLTTEWEREGGNQKVHDMCGSFGNRVMDDYLAFISDLTDLEIKPDFNAYKFLSLGIDSITYSYGFNGKHEWLLERLGRSKRLASGGYALSSLTRNSSNKGYGINKLFLSFDDFRADLDIFTANLILGHQFKIQYITDEDKEARVRSLSTAELHAKKAEAENYISEHDCERYSTPELQEHVTYSDIIKSARRFRNWYDTLDELDEYENQLELYEEELSRRKETQKAAPTASSNYQNSATEVPAAIPHTIPWERKESRPYCKCLYPSCKENGVREGFCWYHYQEEHYLSK